jgi:hypothetical protein
MRIDGSSNKNDWSVEVDVMEGALWLSVQEDGYVPDSVYFMVPSGELKSDVSMIMDRLMYRALKTAQHPNIVYTLGSDGLVFESATDTTIWSTTGTLDLAGVTDTLGATVSSYEDADGNYVFAGAHTMSMKEHNIKPPTAMFGALHTREHVTIVFNLLFGESEAEPVGAASP